MPLHNVVKAPVSTASHGEFVPVWFGTAGGLLSLALALSHGFGCW